MFKKGIILIIMVAALLACFPILSVNANGTQPYLEDDAAAKVMAAYIDNHPDLQAAISSASAPLSVELGTDITLVSTLMIPAGKDITLTGDSKLIGAGGQATITVNGKLTLDGITVTHGSGNYGRGVTVNAGGELILKSGKISGNNTNGLRNANGGGSGVCVNGTGGAAVFIMNGGIISGNISPCNDANHNGGGGVQVFSNGGAASFTMNAGTISGNTATANGANGGGVFLSGNSSGYTAFIMNGGIISDNSSSNGGGVFNFGGDFKVYSGAQIIGNHATTKDGGGVYNQTGASASRGRFIMYGGQISGNDAAETGGGVRNNNADFEMRGGEISGNTSIGKPGGSGGGGGVMNINGAAFTLVDGKITGNTSTLVVGGGVHNKTSNTSITTFNMTGGEISGNTAPNGAGVINWSDKSDPGVFNMDGGSITANITTSDEGKGGGVYNYNLADFTMRGGTISGHTTASYGGGIYNTGSVSDSGAVVTIEGGSVSGNQAKVDGGGIYNTGGTARIDIKDGYVSGNTAITDGGGVWTDDLTSLTVSAGVAFSSNSASVAYNRDPADDALYAAQILGTQWTVPLTQGYNNYDISYRNGTPVSYTVTYDANGGNGSYQDSNLTYGSEYVVLPQSETGITNPGHAFQGWNTAPNGSGTQYQDGSTIPVPGNLTLYAQWLVISGGNIANNVLSGEPRGYAPYFERVIEIEENEVPLKGSDISEINENEVPLTGANSNYIFAGSACLLILCAFICLPRRRDK